MVLQDLLTQSAQVLIGKDVNEKVFLTYVAPEIEKIKGYNIAQVSQTKRKGDIHSSLFVCLQTNPETEEKIKDNLTKAIRTATHNMFDIMMKKECPLMFKDEMIDIKQFNFSLIDIPTGNTIEHSIDKYPAIIDFHIRYEDKDEAFANFLEDLNKYNN